MHVSCQDHKGSKSFYSKEIFLAHTQYGDKQTEIVQHRYGQRLMGVVYSKRAGAPIEHLPCTDHYRDSHTKVKKRFFVWVIPREAT